MNKPLDITALELDQALTLLDLAHEKTWIADEHEPVTDKTQAICDAIDVARHALQSLIESLDSNGSDIEALPNAAQSPLVNNTIN